MRTTYKYDAKTGLMVPSAPQPAGTCNMLMVNQLAGFGAGGSSVTTYFLVGLDGVYTSNDLISWTQQFTSNDNGKGIVYNSSLGFFTFVGNNGDFWKSSAGEIWTDESGFTTNNLNGAAGGDTVTMVGGVNGNVWKTSDGVNVTDVSPSGLSEVASFTFGNGTFAIGDNNNEVWSTTDEGSNWTSTGTLDSQTFKHITAEFFDGTFVFITSDPELFYTTDPSDKANFTKTDFSNQPRAIAYDGATYVIFGDSGFVATSTDLDNWTTQTISTSDDLTCGTWDGKQFVTIDGGDVFTSKDGTSWSSVASSPNNFPRELIALQGFKL